jgi:hypothetical protein
MNGVGRIIRSSTVINKYLWVNNTISIAAFERKTGNASAKHTIRERNSRNHRKDRLRAIKDIFTNTFQPLGLTVLHPLTLTRTIRLTWSTHVHEIRTLQRFRARTYYNNDDNNKKKNNKYTVLQDEDCAAPGGIVSTRLTLPASSRPCSNHSFIIGATPGGTRYNETMFRHTYTYNNIIITACTYYYYYRIV